MSTLKSNIKMFNQVNSDCLETGELFVPMTEENVDFYVEQMENLEFNQDEIEEFRDWIVTM
jgi:hypothetical protein